MTYKGTAADDVTTAVKWSGGKIIALASLPGTTYSVANGINDSGQVVGDSIVGGIEYATEWSGGSVIHLEAGASANAINDAGQVVGGSVIGGVVVATEWSGGGSVIDLGNLPGFTYGRVNAINDAGQVVGYSGSETATEWSDGSIINLEGLPGYTFSDAGGINDIGQVVGESEFYPLPPLPVPEPSTWAMMLVGFSGMAFVGYRLRST